MPVGRKEIIVGLLLLWLALTGGYSGRQEPDLVLINLALWLALMIFSFPRGPLTWPVLAIIAATLISAWFNRSWYGLQLAAVWAGYLAISDLAARWKDETIHNAARLTLPLYILVALVLLPRGNTNIVAFNLVGLALLASPAFNWWLFAPVILAVGGLLHSMGGIIAAVFSTWPHFRQGKVVLGVSVVPLVLLGWWANPAGYAWRLEFWAAAWQGFVSSPVWGIGPGRYYTLVNDPYHWAHAHNIIMTTLAETGLLGLIALAGLAWSIWRRWGSLPAWAAALVSAFVAWSLVDEPLRFWGPGAMMMIALSRLRANRSLQ